MQTDDILMGSKLIKIVNFLSSRRTRWKHGANLRLGIFQYRMIEIYPQIRRYKEKDQLRSL